MPSKGLPEHWWIVVCEHGVNAHLAESVPDPGCHPETRKVVPATALEEAERREEAARAQGGRVYEIFACPECGRYKASAFTCKGDGSKRHEATEAEAFYVTRLHAEHPGGEGVEALKKRLRGASAALPYDDELKTWTPVQIAGAVQSARRKVDGPNANGKHTPPEMFPELLSPSEDSQEPRRTTTEPCIGCENPDELGHECACPLHWADSAPSPEQPEGEARCPTCGSDDRGRCKANWHDHPVGTLGGFAVNYCCPDDFHGGDDAR